MSESSHENDAGFRVSGRERRNRARRSILRTLVVGGGAMTAARAIPEQWVRPVVEVVVLPGHAATSASQAALPVDPVGTFSSGTVSLTAVNQPAATRIADAAAEREVISDELLEFFMPSASAQAQVCNGACEVQFNAEVQNITSYICVDGDLTDYITAAVVPGSPPTMSPSESNHFFLNSGEFQGGNWRLNLRYKGTMTNAVTDVRLSPGGTGCGR